MSELIVGTMSALGLVATAAGVSAALDRRCPPPVEEGRGWTLLSHLALGGAAAQLAVSLVFLFRSALAVPGYDTWLILARLAGNDPFSAAWMQYEHHRLFLLNLLTWLDVSLFGGASRLTFAVFAALTAATAWMVCAGLRRFGRERAVIRLAAAAVLGLPSSLICGSVLFHPYRLWVPLCLILGLGVMAALARAVMSARPESSKGVFAASAAAGLCTLAGAPGMLVWPALLLTALLARASWRMMAAWAAAAAVMLGVYLFGFEGFFTKETSNLLHPAHVLLSLAAFVGQPAAAALFIRPFSDFALPVAVVVGGAAAAGAGYALLRAVAHPPRRPDHLVALGMVVFCLGWVSATVTKHQPLPGTPWAPYVNEQDLMPALALVAALVVLGLQGLDGRFERKAARWSLASALTMLLLLPLPAAVQSGLQLMRREAQVELASLAYVAGTTTGGDEGSQELRIYDRSPELRRYLASASAAPLAHAAERAVGLPLAVLGSMPQEACAGRVLGRDTVTGGERLWGEWNDAARRRRIVILDGEDLLVTGIGKGMDRPPGGGPPLTNLPARGGWMGYAAGRGGRVLGVSETGTPLCVFS